MQSHRRTERLICELLKQNAVIMSGLAMGIDWTAHTTTIEKKGQTIAVLGTSISEYYPYAHKQLQKRLMKEYLVISQFAEGTPIQPQNFPLRNKLMALLSDVCIIVQACEKSGTRHAAFEMARLNKPLYIHEETIQQVSWAKELYRKKKAICWNDTNVVSLPKDII